MTIYNKTKAKHYQTFNTLYKTNKNR